MSFVHLAWAPKLFYGVFTDTFPIFGSRKINYLILCGLLQALTTFSIGFCRSLAPIHIVYLAMLSNLCGAVNDVVIDGLMVILAKQNP